MISPEDNGSIPLATATGITFLNPGNAFVSGVVGAGLFGGAGTGSGDYDFLRVEATAGQNVTVDVDTPIDGLDSTVSISSIAGIEFLFDDDDGETFDTLASFAVPAAVTRIVSPTFAERAPARDLMATPSSSCPVPMRPSSTTQTRTI